MTHCEVREMWFFDRIESSEVIRLINTQDTEKDKKSTTSNGRTTIERIDEADRAGENIVGTTKRSTITSLLNSLENSPGHKANLYRPRFNAVGFGYFDNATRVVQVFADMK